MSFFSKLFSPQKEHMDTENPMPDIACPHTAVVPRWDNNEDMGKQDLISSYYCTACERTLSPEEAQPYLG